MSFRRVVSTAVVLAVASSGGAVCQATQWRIKEIFSNSTGSVQFIELFSYGANEQALAGKQWTATSDGVAKTYTLGANLIGSTSNKHYLIATPGFGALEGGVAPDASIASAETVPFFDPNADNITINIFGDDEVTFAGSFLPKDGVNGIIDHDPLGAGHLQAIINTPTNFSGELGSVNLPPPAQANANFNDFGVVDGADLDQWKSGYGVSGAALHFEGDADLDADVDGGDFLVWQQQVSTTPALAGVSSVAEPTALGLSLPMLAVLAYLRWRRSATSRQGDLCR